MKQNKNAIKFDPSDLNGMRKIMDKYGDSETMLSGTNEHGETVYISIFQERIIVRTLQDNGWCRLNTYYRDGSREEKFDGRHDRY